jgi:hypothetical protein
VRDVEFFQVGEAGEAGYAGEPVGLDGEDLEVGEGREILCVSVDISTRKGTW